MYTKKAPAGPIVSGYGLEVFFEKHASSGIRWFARKAILQLSAGALPEMLRE